MRDLSSSPVQPQNQVELAKHLLCSRKEELRQKETESCGKTDLKLADLVSEAGKQRIQNK